MTGDDSTPDESPDYPEFYSDPDTITVSDVYDGFTVPFYLDRLGTTTLLNIYQHDCHILQATTAGKRLGGLIAGVVAEELNRRKNAGANESQLLTFPYSWRPPAWADAMSASTCWERMASVDVRPFAIETTRTLVAVVRVLIDRLG